MPKQLEITPEAIPSYFYNSISIVLISPITLELSFKQDGFVIGVQQFNIVKNPLENGDILHIENIKGYICAERINV
jgi:hypothetical protein